MSKFNYFTEKKWDILVPLAPLLNNGALHINTEGKLEYKVRMQHCTPWVHAVQTRDICRIAHEVCFDCFNFIHSACRNCWKVVTRPPNLYELFRLHEYQRALKHRGKCGVEFRGFVFGNYGGYFYCDSTSEALELRDQIRSDLGFSTVAKRGCTEFERGKGPSFFWDQNAANDELEEYLASIIIMDKKPTIQILPEYVERNSKRMWIEFAYDRGDETYKNFTGGKSIHVQVKTYEWPENKEALSECDIS